MPPPSALSKMALTLIKVLALPDNFRSTKADLDNI